MRKIRQKLLTIPFFLYTIQSKALKKILYQVYNTNLTSFGHGKIPFLAHLAKGNVNFCHHLASVVCRPLTFHILIFSSETP
jgi:hypothetical protein